jgi:hypothetical protein
MLSARERRALCDIEQRLTSDDPRLAALMARDLLAVSRRLTVRAHDVVVVLAVMLAVLCAALSAVGPGLVAGLFAGVVLAIRRVRFRGVADTSG